MWTTSLKNARAYAYPERDHGVYQVLGTYRPEPGPRCLYRAEVEVDDSAVLDKRDRLLTLSPDRYAEAAERLAMQGYEWVLITEGPVVEPGNQMRSWTVAVYVGKDPVPAVRVADG